MAPPRRGRKPPLEVRSHADAAWYDGDIYLEGSRLRVHFNGFGSEHDEFWEGEYLKSTTKFLEIIRLRSRQLQDFECTQIDVGIVVCANFKTSDGSESKYYDARVLMIHQSPHAFLKGKRELCKCRFKLAWEAGPFRQKEIFLGCADISLIDPESVEKHPVARMVLQAARDHVEGSKDVVTEGFDHSLPSEDVEADCAEDIETEGSQQSLPSEELICTDILSDDLSSKYNVDGSFPVLDIEGLPDDIVQVMKGHAIFYDFLGKEADKLEEALKIYNARNNDVDATVAADFTRL